ncbi:hypothetical protein WN943_029101 [Citrus x changshan-huyou]
MKDLDDPQRILQMDIRRDKRNGSICSSFQIELFFMSSFSRRCDYMAHVPYASDLGELDKRRATTSYIFESSKDSISLRSVLQSKITLSTTEAKKIAATKATKETIWFKSLLGDLRVIYENIEPYKPTYPINEDPKQLYSKYKQVLEDYMPSKVLPSLREKHDEYDLLRELLKS